MQEVKTELAVDERYYSYNVFSSKGDLLNTDLLNVIAKNKLSLGRVAKKAAKEFIINNPLFITNALDEGIKIMLMDNINNTHQFYLIKASYLLNFNIV